MRVPWKLRLTDNYSLYITIDEYATGEGCVE